MVQIPSWTGYPFLPNPALLLTQFRAGDRRILKMLFYHFYPGLCLFAIRFISNEETAKAIADKSLEELWANRSGIESLEAIKIHLYVDTYQRCSQFKKTVQKEEETVKSPLGGDPKAEEEAMAAIVYAEILSSIEEMPGAPEWLSGRLQQLPAGQLYNHPARQVQLLLNQIKMSGRHPPSEPSVPFPKTNYLLHMPSPTIFPGKTKDPFQVITDFCRNYHHHEVQEMLWDWLVTAISRNNSIYDDGKERGSLFLLYENITLLVAAAYAAIQKPPPPPPSAPAPKVPITKNKKSGPARP